LKFILQKKSAELSSADFVLIGYISYRVAGVATVSVFIASGVVFIVAAVSVTVGDTDCVLLAAVESVLPDGIELSFVPQLTANNPRPAVNNNSFFITNLF
jgi:hypothetical protein